MTGRLRVGAQVVAVGFVVALLGLLVWKVAKGTDNDVTGSLASGGTPAAPAFSLERLDREGELELALGVPIAGRLADLGEPLAVAPR